MNNLASALGQKFIENKDKVRIRTFELGGHTFKVKVPLTSEFEVMQQRMSKPDEAKVEKYFQELTSDLQKFKDDPTAQEKCVWTDDDVTVDGRSMREAAKNKQIAETRITEMFKLLVPEEQGFDMETITYEMIEELFPFPVQMQVVEEIGKTISPTYEAERKK